METMFRVFLLLLLPFFAWIFWLLMRAGEERQASVSHHHDGPMDSSATDVAAGEPLTTTSSVATSESEKAPVPDPIHDEASPQAIESMTSPSTADSSAARTPAADEASPATPPASRADKLTRIKGIGRVLELKLNELGITSFQQIAAFTAEDIERVNERLPFKGRIERDRWVEQAKGILDRQR